MADLVTPLDPVKGRGQRSWKYQQRAGGLGIELRLISMDRGPADSGRDPELEPVLAGRQVWHEDRVHPGKDVGAGPDVSREGMGAWG